LPLSKLFRPRFAAEIAEAFTPRLRYSGSSLGYQFASVIAGGPAPLIATALFAILCEQFNQMAQPEAVKTGDKCFTKQTVWPALPALSRDRFKQGLG